MSTRKMKKTTEGCDTGKTRNISEPKKAHGIFPCSLCIELYKLQHVEGT